jgi:hypothetical protein
MHYRLNEYDVRRVRQILEHRQTRDDRVDWVEPKSPYGVNGQAFLDGDQTLWVTSAPQGDWPGSWDWPERVEA